MTGRLLHEVQASPPRRQRTRLNCYSEPPSTSPSVEAGGSCTRVLIPGGVCLWLTMTTVVNIQDDDRCCRRRIFLTTRVVASSFLFSTIGFKCFYIKSLEMKHNDRSLLTDRTEFMADSCSFLLRAGLCSRFLPSSRTLLTRNHHRFPDIPSSAV